jgi:hypothetical protein
LFVTSKTGKIGVFIMSDPIGEFSLQHTGNTYGTNSAGDMTSSANFQGEASGFGMVWGTLVSSNPLSETNATSGEVQWVGEAFLEDGSVLGGIGKGTWEKPENEHRWNLVMHIDLSDGEKQRSEGSIDLETLIFTGKIYQG